MDGGEREREESPDVRREPAKGGRTGPRTGPGERASERARSPLPLSTSLSRPPRAPVRTHTSVRHSAARDPGSASRRENSRSAVRACGHGRAKPPPPLSLSLMILPQVHLRKPCYDFYFL